MRIRLLLGADPDKNRIPEQMLALLTKELSKDGSIVLTDENPDVIHLVGAWTSSTVGIAKDAHAKAIAFVHTPLGTLSPWYKPSTSHVKLTTKSTFVVASGQMENELLNDGRMENLKMVLNAVVTQKTSAALMCSEYRAIYHEAVKRNDEAVWDAVDSKMNLLKDIDPVIVNICKNLLYAQYLVQRKNLPQIFLNQLADVMERSDYDEDKLAGVLKLIKLYQFTQNIEHVMMTTANLGEGYMPVPYKEDKASKAMLDMITDYNKLSN